VSHSTTIIALLYAMRGAAKAASEAPQGDMRLNGCGKRGFLGAGVVVLLLPLVNT